ncbi:MAG: translation initiation factor IF-2 [Planctomycetales bacterium]|nr:translation initiation factor IF-2 [Planctomycetales bacterium]
MPKRIYALAKELAIDSKELVDICTKIGIQNKGSALASLEDDEVERIERYFKSSEPPAAPPPPQQSHTPIREPIQEHRASVILKSPPATGPVAKTPEFETVSPAAPVPEVPASELPPASPLSATNRAVTAEPPSPEPPAAPANTPTRRLTRDDYIAPPSATAGRVRVLDARRGDGKKSDEKRVDDRKRPPQKREPVINLAKIPKGAPQAPPPQSNEPAPQRPEIRLTRSAITGHKQGMKAPLEELEQQQAAESAAAKAGRGGKTAVPSQGGLSKFKAAADKAKGRREDEEEDDGSGRGKRSTSGIVAARAERRRKTRVADEGGEEDRRSRDRSSSKRLTRRGTNTAAPRKEKAVLELPCTIRSFSEAAGVPAGRVLGTLMQMGKGVTINANLDPELAEMLAVELGVDLEFRQPQSLEEGLIDSIENSVDPEESLVSRPPIVTFLGHVDHGKTSLLDYLIGTRIVTGEAGGITQHIRAYKVEKGGRTVAFVDTPGHEAFTEMRARGANVTDIAVLVVAADDGIMPQTEEAISHAKAADVPIVVALNKIDLAGVDPNRILTQMTEHGLTPSQWGGDVEVVHTSAITGQGMDELLETLLTVAELNDYKANPDRPALGVCLEAEQAADKGVIAKVVVQNGTLKVGDIVVCGSSHGRVKALYDTLNPNIQLTSAGPSTPVNITGLDSPPGAGDRFHVLSDIAQARELAESRSAQSRSQSLSGTSPKVSFETFQELLQSGRLGKVEERVELNLIIRADARGSLEAIEKELSKLEHPEVELRVLQKSVGGISVADVTLASASQAVIVGFNVIPDEAARSLADERNVEIRRYDIIYKLAEDIRAIVEGRLRPEERIVELGRALVKTTFTITRVGTVAGCYVMQGSIERGCRIRVSRDSRIIGDYALDSLKRHKDDVKEVPRGMECGIKLAGFNDLKQDDVLEAYRIEEVARKLE